MSESGSDPDIELMEEFLRRMMARDHAGMVAMVADDAEFYDPHYPIAHMRGRSAISRGLEWSLGILVKPGFAVTRAWIEGGSGVAEVATHHVLKGGMEVDFDQVFLFEVRDQKIQRLRAFVPYRQPGIGGWIPRVTGFFWRLRGRG